MRTIPFIIVIIGLSLLVTTPAHSNQRRDYIEDRLFYWIDYAENLDYEIIETEINSIHSDKNHYFYLEPGTYHAYAEGCDHIDDLDMAALDREGWELDRDYMNDNFPVVSFTLWDWEEVEFDISVHSFNDHHNRGYFCFVLSRERDYRQREGYKNHYDDRSHDRDRYNRHDFYLDDCDDRDDDYSHYWDDDNYWCDWHTDWDNWWCEWDDGEWRCYRESNWSNRERRRYIEHRLYGLTDFAHHRRLHPIMDEIGEIGDTVKYTLTLHRGYYVFFASGGPWIDDLDLHVSWRRGREFANDIGIDTSPAVWCYLPHRTTIEIVVEVWSFNDSHYEDYFCILVCKG